MLNADITRFVIYIRHFVSGIEFDESGCDRDCSIDIEKKECRYKLNIETYSTMSKACFDCPHTESDCYRPDCVTGDGYKRQLYTVNRQLPAPQIRVCWLL